MKALRALLASIAFLALAHAFSACGPDIDYYSQVKDACTYSRPDAMVPYFNYWDPLRTTLTEECREALEDILPYDDSFDKAPPGFKNFVTQAFQVMVGYPIAFPDNGTIFGTRPSNAGGIPIALSGLLINGANRNQNIFNYVMNQIDVIRYEEKQGTANAEMRPTIDGIRTMTVFRQFWDPTQDFSILGVPTEQVATIFHEVRHADGLWHLTCSEDTGGGFAGLNACDPELNGAYGWGSIFGLALIQGSIEQEARTGRASLSEQGMLLLAEDACVRLKYNVNRRYQELDDLLQPLNCYWIDEAWVREHIKPNR